MKKIIALLLCVSTVALTMVGCGSASTEAEAPAATEETAEATESAESTEAATENTASDKVWIVATDTVFKPFEYTNENNEFVGIDVDLLAAIAEDQGFKYELQSLGWDAAVAAVQSGQADAIIAGATIKQERIDSGWIFSDGYYDATQTFTVAAGISATSCWPCAGATAALNLSWTSRFTAREGRSMARNKVLRPGSARGATTASVTETARPKNARKSISYPSLSA